MKFYAVQNGEDYDWDYGSESYEEAVKMAEALSNDSKFDGEEIRIAVIDTEYNVCDNVIVIREGESYENVY